MQLRSKKTGASAYASEFNPYGMSEIIVYFHEGDCDTDYIRNYECLLETGPRAGQWVCLAQAMRDHDVITDNYVAGFFEPETEEDRARGYTLY